MNRLPYAVSNAPAIKKFFFFLKKKSLLNVVCYLDDILITDKNEHEHWKNVEQELQRSQDRSIRANRD